MGVLPYGGVSMGPNPNSFQVIASQTEPSQPSRPHLPLFEMHMAVFGFDHAKVPSKSLPSNCFNQPLVLLPTSGLIENPWVVSEQKG